MIDVSRLRIRPGSAWSRAPLVAAAVGLAALAVSFVLGRGEAQSQLYFSWLVAFTFCLSIALGGLFFVLVHFVSNAGWGVVVRRLAEDVMATLPLFAALFVPVALGAHELYHWSHENFVARDPLLQAKEPYLNTGFFLVRAAIYFACWIGIAWFYASASGRQDSTGQRSITRRLTAASGPAIVIFAITVSFAAIDWLMSLEPHWYSTIFGVYFFSGCLVAIFAFLVLLALALSRAGYLRGTVTVDHFHDLGKLLFAFTIFWTYIAFSQYFLIWYGNIPEETVWYIDRLQGSWKALSILLGLGHFVVPFFFLMPRTVKRRPGPLALGATWMLLMHLLDIYWLVMPTLHPEGARPHLLDLTTLVAVGGLFLGALAWALRRQALVPLRDPRLAESLLLENV